MPRLSDSMNEGTIVSWLAASGDTVARGQELVEIETDKATMAYEAPADGHLQIVAVAGTTVPVGGTIAYLGDSAAGIQPPPISAAQRPREPEEHQGTPGIASQDDTAANISPVARRLAATLGVDLAVVAASGPGGRIVKQDIVRASAHAADDVRGAFRLEPLTRTQRLTARRVAAARSTVPDFTIYMDVDMTAALELREKLTNERDPRPTINDLVVAAVGRTLPQHPYVNASYVEGRFELYKRVNVGIAVSVGRELIVPTLADVNRKSLAEVAAESRRLISRTRRGEITPSELAGGTFTVSNLGMFGVTSFQPIINAPQAAILAVGTTRRGPRHDDPQRRRMAQMTVTLVSDHRIVYGAQAALFLADFRDLLEHPDRLTLIP